MSKHHEPVMTGTKICTNCNKKLPVICFAIEKDNTDGLQGRCRECCNNRTKELRALKQKNISDRKLKALKHHYSFRQLDE